MTEQKRPKLNFEDKIILIRKLAEISQGIYDAIWKAKQNPDKRAIQDTRDYKGHDESSIDVDARNRAISLIEKYMEEFEGYLRFEHLPYKKKLAQNSSGNEMCLIIDEIEGTTNVKRWLASSLEYFPLAGISFALCLDDFLSSMVVSLFHTFDSNQAFASARTEEGSFVGFRRDHDWRHIAVIDKKDYCATKGDSRSRVVVACYSNSHRKENALIEEAIYGNGLKVYGGCRASGVDIINILRNQFDAYIDLRHLLNQAFPSKKEEAELQVYDCAGAIGVALGCGLEVCDCSGKPWEEFHCDDAVNLIVCRPNLKQKILDAIKPLVDDLKSKLPDKPSTGC